MGAVQIASLAEGVAMAEQAGLDMNLVAEALSTGAVASPQVIRHSKRMVARDFSGASFTAALRHKDAAYAVALAETLLPDVPVSRAALAAYDTGEGERARRRRRQDDRDRLAAEIGLRGNRVGRYPKSEHLPAGWTVPTSLHLQISQSGPIESMFTSSGTTATGNSMESRPGQRLLALTNCPEMHSSRRRDRFTSG